MIVVTIMKLGRSPVTADKAPANSRIKTNGLRNRPRKRTHPGEGLAAVASFGP